MKPNKYISRLESATIERLTENVSNDIINSNHQS